MKRILVVDDNRVIRRVIRQMLETCGLTVAEAEDGVQCLKQCREQGVPDGIILDINMPEMDGITCLQTMRADPAFRECVIVMCTTQVEIQQIVTALSAGANEYVMKPFTEEILREKLRTVGLLA
ncbi:MAG: response regulator [Planctomycetaceae bacterium]|nr:response regulator [Planctomycetaceae bacterium]